MIADDKKEDERPELSIGFLNVGDAYYAAAAKLKQLNLPTSHRDFPVQFLYHQAIELYLKALLRQQGYSGKKLWGHLLKPLAKRARDKGITFDAFDWDTFRAMDHFGISEKSRYLRSGYYENYPELIRLEIACENVRLLAERSIKSAGTPVRPTPLQYALGEKGKDTVE